MTLTDAFTGGHLPRLGVASIPLHDRFGLLIGFYVDPQSHLEFVTLQ